LKENCSNEVYKNSCNYVNNITCIGESIGANQGNTNYNE